MIEVWSKLSRFCPLLRRGWHYFLGTPRLLVALGVPLDEWIVALGAGLAIRLNRNVALWGATVLATTAPVM